MTQDDFEAAAGLTLIAAMVVTVVAFGIAVSLSTFERATGAAIVSGVVSMFVAGPIFYRVFR